MSRGDAVATSGAPALPEGVVTFLFSDIEGSTKLLHRLGDGYADVLLTHQRLMRECFDTYDGREVDTEGDAFFVAFASPRQAVAAAVAIQRVLQRHPWPHGEPVLVRMGLHTGEPVLVEGKYVGMDVHLAARVCSAAHGGQVLVSGRVHDLVSDRLPDGVAFLDLGEHTLKDVPETQRLLQLDIDGLPATFPPVRSQRPPTNLPHHATEVVGRRQELSDLASIVRSGCRLVTVTGPGGVGKTRLVGAAAASLAPEFVHGTYFVDVTPVVDGDLVLPTIARVLGVAFDGADDAQRALAAHLADRRVLIVVDNFEQVRDGARQVGGLLEACPGLHILVTSRLLLDLQGEQEFVLTPMGLPRASSLDAIAESDAVRLFVERARMARQSFELTEHNAQAVAEVCDLLDGLPLAIELAAARVRLFTPQALVQRLGNRFQVLSGGSVDAPERHRALRATIDWSCRLLSEQEHEFFLAMAVFDGGARFDSIEAVCGPGGDVLELLSSLVKHSLLQQREDPDGELRFRMLQTLRDYAQELLAEDPAYRSEVCERHARHFLALAEEHSVPVSGIGGDWAVLDPEQHNLRAALTFWLERADGSAAESRLSALRLAATLSTYWYHHGMSLEGSTWLDRALAAVPEPPPELEARAVRMLGVLAEQARDLDRATRLLHRALELFRELGDRSGEGKCLNSLGVAARSARRPEEAVQFLRETVEIRRELEDVLGETTTLNNLGIVYMDLGRWDEARDIFSRNLRRDNEAEDVWGAACSHLNLGVALLNAGHLTDAEPHVRDALTIFFDLDDPDGGVEALEAAGGVAAMREQWVVAARVLGAAAAARDVLKLAPSEADQLHLARWLTQVRERLEPAALDAAWQEGAAMTYPQAARYALELLGRPAASRAGHGS